MQNDERLRLVDTEKSLAGILLQKPQVIAEIFGLVTERDFVDHRAKEVFILAEKKFRAGEPFDLVIAASLMPQHASWLADAFNTIPIHYRSYALQINDSARCRRIKDGAKKIIQAHHSEPASNLLEQLSSIHKQEQRNSLKSGNIKDVASRTIDIIEKNRSRGKLHGKNTGFDFLSKAYVRYVPGHMWVITGFTSAGKTTLSVEMQSRLKKSNVLSISTEMTEEQLVARMVARETGIHNQKILSGNLAVDEYDNVMKHIDEIGELNLEIIDNIRELNEIEAAVIQKSMTSGVDVVFIDYVQQIRCSAVPRKEWGAEAADRIQNLAKRANTCIICMSQVSNQVGRGEVDQLEAKGAGEWAACADVGIRLRRKSDDPTLLGFDMMKGRHYGQLNHALRFANNFTRIEEW